MKNNGKFLTKEEQLEIDNLIRDLKIPSLQGMLKKELEKDILTEYQLNKYHNTPELSTAAFNRRCYKANGYKKIANDLPDSVIQEPDTRFLQQLDKIRIRLAKFYAETLGNELNEEKKQKYEEVKQFILIKKDDKKKAILRVNTFDLLISSLEIKEEIDDLEQIHHDFSRIFNFIKQLDLIENEKIKEVLADISNLGTEFSEIKSYSQEEISSIKCYFYAIFREIDKDEKVRYFFLLKKISTFVEEHCNSSLLKTFSIHFIDSIINDNRLIGSDLGIAIGLVYRALEKFHTETHFTNLNFFLNKVAGEKSLGVYLKKYEEIFMELIKTPIPNLGTQKDKNDIQIAIYFPVLESIPIIVRENFHKSLKLFNFPVKKQKSTTKYFAKLSKNLISLGGKVLQNMVEGMENVADNLNENVVATAGKFKEKKNPHSNTFEINGCGIRDQVQANELSNLNKLKEKLSKCGDKLNSLNLYISSAHFAIENKGIYIENNEIYQYDLVNSLESSVNECASFINEKIRDYIAEMQQANLKSINEIRQENYWFEINTAKKLSLTEKLFNRGYFSVDWVRKKLEMKLGRDAAFSKYKFFFKETNFWILLSCGVIRWPWINKGSFASSWAEQLCLPRAIELQEELSNTIDTITEEQILEKILLIAKYIDPARNLEFFKHFVKFKINIAKHKYEIDILHGEIDRLVMEEEENKEEKENLSSNFSSKKSSIFSKIEIHTTFSKEKLSKLIRVGLN